MATRSGMMKQTLAAALPSAVNISGKGAFSLMVKRRSSGARHAVELCRHPLPEPVALGPARDRGHTIHTPHRRVVVELEAVTQPERPGQLVVRQDRSRCTSAAWVSGRRQHRTACHRSCSRDCGATVVVVQIGSALARYALGDEFEGLCRTILARLLAGQGCSRCPQRRCRQGVFGASSVQAPFVLDRGRATRVPRDHRHRQYFRKCHRADCRQGLPFGDEEGSAPSSSDDGMPPRTKRRSLAEQCYG